MKLLWDHMLGNSRDMQAPAATHLWGTSALSTTVRLAVTLTTVLSQSGPLADSVSICCSHQFRAGGAAVRPC